MIGTKDCKTNYHNNFMVHKNAKVRTYYGGVPEYIQVGRHQYVEAKIVRMWTNMMLVGWYVYLRRLVFMCSLLC